MPSPDAPDAPDALNELRGILKRIREDLGKAPPLGAPGALPPAPGEVPAEAGGPSPVSRAAGAPEIRPLPRVAEAEERRPPRRLSPARAPGRAPNAVWPHAAQAACLAVAAAGAYLDKGGLLAAGLFGLFGGALFGIAAPSEGDSRLREELDRRLNDVEERIAVIGSARIPGGVSRELEEEIRELRRIMMSLFKVLEEPAAPKAASEDD